jgi:hypothetical protein
MKESLGLNTIAYRTYILGAIETFRLRSNGWKEYQLKHGSHILAQSLMGSGFNMAVPPTPPGQELPAIANSAIAAESSLDQQLNDLLNTRTSRGEFEVTDELGQKRRKLDLTKPASNIALQNEDDAFFDTPHQDDQETPQTAIPTPILTPEATSSSDKKRKRIAPTLITSEIDLSRDREGPTAADNVVQFDPQNVEPGVPFVGEDGRKRLVPVHQPDDNDDEPYDYQALLRNPRGPTAIVDVGAGQALAVFQPDSEGSRNKDNFSGIQTDAVGYLGKKKMPVDDIFYESVSVGQELPASDESFAFTGHHQPTPAGRRIYVNRVIKHYLQADHVGVYRDGKPFMTVQPYPARFVARHVKPSFTLFGKGEDGKVHVRREELQAWPELDPNANRTMTSDGNTVTFNISAPGMLDGIGTHDPLDPDLLDKYNYIDGGDEILPLYGDSDEENEYDMEIWKEIEEERGTSFYLGST